MSISYIGVFIIFKNLKLSVLVVLMNEISVNPISRYCNYFICSNSKRSSLEWFTSRYFNFIKFTVHNSWIPVCLIINAWRFSRQFVSNWLIEDEYKFK